LNQLALNRTDNNHDHACQDLEMMAEQEFAAFFNAITELFGTEQAELSAEDWLQELASINALPDSTHEWRRLTMKVSARLAKRVKIALPLPPAIADSAFLCHSR
jgi:hypothetical protein